MQKQLLCWAAFDWLGFRRLSWASKFLMALQAQCYANIMTAINFGLARGNRLLRFYCFKLFKAHQSNIKRESVSMRFGRFGNRFQQIASSCSFLKRLISAANELENFFQKLARNLCSQNTTSSLCALLGFNSFYTFHTHIRGDNSFASGWLFVA